MSITVEGPNPGHFRWTITFEEKPDGLDFEHALASVLDGCFGGDVQLWIREVAPRSDDIAVRAGFIHYRDLWQLRCALPNSASGLATRAFDDDDVDEIVRVNNRAFHWHPEQSGLTADALLTTMTEPGFDADGFRLLHGEDDGLIGFCWTKVHPEGDPPLGEIYVIAIDPSHHGQGLGRPMTLAGLEWLSAQGLEHGMLYVESDNDPANAIYSGIGFTRHHTDRAYRLDR